MSTTSRETLLALLTDYTDAMTAWQQSCVDHSHAMRTGDNLDVAIAQAVADDAASVMLASHRAVLSAIGDI